MENKNNKNHDKENKETKIETDQHQIITVGHGEHQLQYPYTFWYSKIQSYGNTDKDFNDILIEMGSFFSVEQFWKFYSYLTRPDQLGHKYTYYLFKQGIKPMWEDNANKHGGNWKVTLNKGFASQCWENLILAMLGEQFEVGDELCGAVMSVRDQDKLYLWNKTGTDVATVERIKDTFIRVLNLPKDVSMRYTTHY